MNSSGNDNYNLQSSSQELESIEQEFIIKKTLLTHNPDGRRVDSKLLFQAMESVVFYANRNSDNAADMHTIVVNIENLGSNETLEHTIYKISRAMLWECHESIDIHTKTLVLLELLGHYKWDSKVVIVLAAFAIIYGEFRLISQLNGQNSLASSLALLKNLSWRNLEALKPQFKAMEMVVKEMMDLSKCIIRFEALPLQLVLCVDDDCTFKTSAKSHIYLATYWIFRSSLACASQITDLIAMNQEQVNLNTTVNAAWGLSSLGLRLSNLCRGLKMQVDASQEQIEQKLYEKMKDLVKDQTQVDNQEVLHLFFSLNDDLPLKDCSSSRAKVGISKMKNKIVLLLVSKPELFPIDQTLLLLQQTHDHQNYEILWVPISSSENWTPDEHISYDFLSNTLPLTSIRQPWLLSSAVMKIIIEEWKFREEPLMVALNSQGVITNYNAIDMLIIWGAKAFPFTNSREKELWDEESWNLQLMIDGIDHRFAMKMVEEGTNVCICGSNSLEWIKEFDSRIKKTKNRGLQLQVIYVGSRNSSENMRRTLATINKDNFFTPTKITFFWLRLESIKNSILRVGKTFTSYDQILNEVSELLDIDDHWAVLGCGNSKDFIKLRGIKIMECFDKFPIWAENISKMGFLDAIRNDDSEVFQFESSIRCEHSKMVSYDEGMIQETMICDKCKRPMKQYVVYNCDGTNKLSQ